jgi:cob(I)alamin adenosyltransferase
MNLYTRTGDDGSTGLFGGQRVAKHHPRVAAYGDVDELNAVIGWVCAGLNDPSHPDHSNQSKPGQSAAPPRVDPPAIQRIAAILTTLQSRLFDLGADLATPPNSKHESKVQRISAADVTESERWIDEIDGGNAPITTFVLPGGTELASRLHIARTVCRRAERAMVALNESSEVNPQAIIFINRISDLLFAMARRANKEAGVADVPWHPRG